MTEIEALDYAKRNNILENATSVVAFSNGLFAIDGDLLQLQAQAQSEGVEFYLIKGELPIVNKKDNGTSRTEIQ